MAETWGDCTAVAVSVFRDTADGVPLSGGYDTSPTTTVMYGAATLSTLDGTSWLVAHAFHSTATNLIDPPDGLTNRVSYLLPPPGIVVHDSDGGRTSNWPATGITANVSGYYADFVWEIKNVGSFFASAVALGDTIVLPPGTSRKDLVIATAWQLGADLPTAPAGWEFLGGSISTAHITMGSYKRLPPTFVPVISAY